MGHEGFNGLPVHEMLRLHSVRQAARHKASQQWSPPRVDTDDFPTTLTVGEFNVIGGNEASTHQVDEVTSEQVLRQEQLAWSTFEFSKVDSLSREHDFARSKGCNF